MTATKKEATAKRKRRRRSPLPRTAPKTGPPSWNSGDAQTAAALTRAGLLAGASEEEIRAAAAQRFPDYRALEICVSVYRRELKKKGLLE